MNTLPILIATLCFLAIGYRCYSAFIASKVLLLDGPLRRWSTALRPRRRLAPGGR